MFFCVKFGIGGNMMSTPNKTLKQFSELSLTIQSSKGTMKPILTINGADFSGIISHWKIQQGKQQVPELVLTISLHDVPLVVL